jgi:hypothetical protein
MLVDKLRREQALKNNTFRPQQNYQLLDNEMQGLLKGIQDTENMIRFRSDDILSDEAANGNEIGIITSRSTVSPKYNIRVIKEEKDGNTITFGSTLRTLTGLRNTSEVTGKGGRLRVGDSVTIYKSDTGGEYIDQVPEAPPSFIGVIAGVVPGYPQYEITPPAGYPIGSDSPLLANEVAKLSTVTNLGEPVGEDGYLLIGTSVEVSWRDNGSNDYTPYLSQPVTVFKES